MLQLQAYLWEARVQALRVAVLDFSFLHSQVPDLKTPMFHCSLKSVGRFLAANPRPQPSLPSAQPLKMWEPHPHPLEPSKDRPYKTPERTKPPPWRPRSARCWKIPACIAPLWSDADKRLQRQVDNVFSIRKGLGWPSSFHMREHTQRQIREMPHHSAARLCSKERTPNLG